MKIAQEEIFGPVLSVLAFDDIEHVIDKANAIRTGLPPPFGPRTSRRPIWFPADFRRAPYGSTPTGLMDAALPFGGYKQVGLWPRIGKSCGRALHGTENRLAEHGVKALVTRHSFAAKATANS